ncbi:hypothetical protein [Amaricoccus sp.]|uniref:hypothetical protein n=1 Tax=Amaricoccus sp. TaxID=1872485 RepID=UPI001B4CC891|nr:hypothetical protein [Amaricoccus sp.]MBP7242655.1 hypothetical protein [Amaricoccus sp.]
MSMTQCRPFSTAQWSRTDGADLVGRQARLALGPAGPAGHLAAAPEHDDGVQAGPAVAAVEPCNVVDDGDGTGLDASVIERGQRMSPG